MSTFDGAVPTFILTESIHDLCSRQIARAIKKNEWLKEEDSVMVCISVSNNEIGLWLRNWFFFPHFIGRNWIQKLSRN